MKYLPIKHSGALLAGGVFSLIAHLAAAAALISVEIVQPNNEVSPITVELVLVNKTTLEKEPHAGEIQTADAKAESRILTFWKSHTPNLTASPQTRRALRTSFLIDAMDANADRVTDKSLQETHSSHIVVTSFENIGRHSVSAGMSNFTTKNIAKTAPTLTIPNETGPLESTSSMPPKLSTHLVSIGAKTPLTTQHMKTLDISQLPLYPPDALSAKSPYLHRPQDGEIASAVEAENPDESIHTTSQQIPSSALASDDEPTILATFPYSEVEQWGQDKSAVVTEIQVAGIIRSLHGTSVTSHGVQVLSGNKPPEYPVAARRLGLEGRVILRIEVGSNGTANRVIITESSGSKILDNAGKKAVRHWQFLPAVVNGKAVSEAIDVPFTFRLN